METGSSVFDNWSIYLSQSPEGPGLADDVMQDV